VIQIKKTIAVVLIIFWFSFGFISAIFNANTSIEYKQLRKNFQTESNTITLTNIWGLVWGTTTYFFKCLTLNIGDVPMFFEIFIIILQIISALLIVWFLVEDLGNFVTNMIGKFI